MIASGIAYNYVREVLGEQPAESLLKIGTYPLPVNLLRDLVSHCEEIVVVVEGYPYIETRLNGLLGLPGKSVRGKLSGLLPEAGELTPDSVAAAFGKPEKEEDVPGDRIYEYWYFPCDEGTIRLRFYLIEKQGDVVRVVRDKVKLLT